ncbi:MAG TPA: hypothetical protein VH950_14550, partial [Gaiellaceae bacterium]
MRRRLEPVEEGRQEQRFAEARIPPASGRPGPELAAVAARLGLDRGPDRAVSLGMGVQDQARPVGSRQHPRGEVRDGHRVFAHQWLFLCCERRLE